MLNKLFNKNKVEVVPESEWTDFGDQYATKKHLAIAMCVPVGASVALVANKFTSDTSNILPVNASVSSPEHVTTQPIIDTVTQPQQLFSNQIGDVTNVGATSDFIAETSLNTIANILDPVIHILVAISLPIASVIMIGSLFWFMFGKSEKAWGMIMNAGLGYVLIQLSPLFLKILQQLGEAVQQ